LTVERKGKTKTNKTRRTTNYESPFSFQFDFVCTVETIETAAKIVVFRTTSLVVQQRLEQQQEEKKKERKRRETRQDERKRGKTRELWATVAVRLPLKGN